MCRGNPGRTTAVLKDLHVFPALVDRITTFDTSAHLACTFALLAPPLPSSSHTAALACGARPYVTAKHAAAAGAGEAAAGRAMYHFQSFGQVHRDLLRRRHVLTVVCRDRAAHLHSAGEWVDGWMLQELREEG